MARTWICVALLGLAALFSAPAHADVDAPATAVVATTAEGSTLTAADAATKHGDEQFVVTVRGTDAAHKAFTASDVERPPLWPDESAIADHTDFSDDFSTVHLVVGGAVEAEVATVELIYRGGQVLRMSTVPGAGYAGRHAGQIGFFAGEITLTVAQWGDRRALRLYDADGTLLYAADDNSTTRTVSLLQRRVAGTRARFGAALTSYDDALPLAPLHRAQRLCLTATAGPSDLPEGALNAACQDTPVGTQPMRLGGVRGCGAVPTTLAGFVPAATREVTVVLGSGRRVRYATRVTPFGRSERVVVALLPRGEAIRTATARDDAGRVLVRGNVGNAPPDRRCTSSAREWGFISDEVRPRVGVPPGSQVAAGGPDGPRLLVRELGDQVCTGLDALALDGSDCEDPPLSSRFTWLTIKHYADGRTAVAGMFAAKVATVRLVFADGTRQALPATESAGYTGRFHSALRFAFTVLASGPAPVRADLLDAAGRQVGGAEGDDCDCDPPLRFRTILSQAGYRIAQHGRGDDACIVLAASGRRPTTCDEFAFGDAVADAVVTCAPHQTVVFGVTPHPVRRVELELASGERVPAALRRHNGASSFLAVLPARTAVRAVHFPGVRNSEGRSTVAMPVYGAQKQCGYGFRGSL